MRNAFCHLSISTVSLQQGASFVITLVKLLICHQWMMSWAGRNKRSHRQGMNEERDRAAEGGAHFYQRECQHSQLYRNRDRKPSPTASHCIIILTCGQSVIPVLLSSQMEGPLLLGPSAQYSSPQPPLSPNIPPPLLHNPITPLQLLMIL